MSDTRKMIVITPELHKDLKVIAAQEGRSIGRQVEWMLRDAVEKRKQQS